MNHTGTLDALAPLQAMLLILYYGMCVDKGTVWRGWRVLGIPVGADILLRLNGLGIPPGTMVHIHEFLFLEVVATVVASPLLIGYFAFHRNGSLPFQGVTTFALCTAFLFLSGWAWRIPWEEAMLAANLAISLWLVRKYP